MVGRNSRSGPERSLNSHQEKAHRLSHRSRPLGSARYRISSGLMQSVPTQPNDAAKTLASQSAGAGCTKRALRTIGKDLGVLAAAWVTTAPGHSPSVGDELPIGCSIFTLHGPHRSPTSRLCITTTTSCISYSRQDSRNECVRERRNQKEAEMTDGSLVSDLSPVGIHLTIACPRTRHILHLGTENRPWQSRLALRHAPPPACRIAQGVLRHSVSPRSPSVTPLASALADPPLLIAGAVATTSREAVSCQVVSDRKGPCSRMGTWDE